MFDVVVYQNVGIPWGNVLKKNFDMVIYCPYAIWFWTKNFDETGCRIIRMLTLVIDGLNIYVVAPSFPQIKQETDVVVVRGIKPRRLDGLSWKGIMI